MDYLSIDILKETRRMNNIPEGEKNEELLVKTLNLFFTPLLTNRSLKSFANLVELISMGQQVKNLSFLKYCPKIKKLWICEGGLKSMQGIRCAKSLEELVLFDNNISLMEELESITTLRRLWINDNEILNLTEMKNLTGLIDLNLAGNKIAGLNNALLPLSNLETLNISGNLLCNLQDIFLLTNLPKLKFLTLNDPQYLPSIITLQPHTLLALSHQIPQLDTIDDICLDKPFRSLIDSIILDKKLFFYSAFRHRHNQLLRSKRELDKVRSDVSKVIIERIRLLDLQAKLNESHIERAPKIEIIALKRSIRSIRDRIVFWKRRLEDIEFEIEQSASFSLNRCVYTTELQMFGCLSIDPINKSSDLFRFCEKFLQMRVCWHDKSFLPFSKIRLKNIWHVQNALLNEHRHPSQPECDELFLYNGVLSTDDDFRYLGEILRCGFSNERTAGNFRFTSILNKLLPTDKLTTGRLYHVSFIILVVRAVKREQDNCFKTGIIYPLTNGFLSNRKRKFCACSLAHFEYDFDNCDGIILEFIAEIQLISMSAVSRTAANLNNIADFASELEDLKSIPNLQDPPNLSESSTTEALEHQWFSHVDPKKMDSLTRLNLFGTGFRSFQSLKELTSLTSLSLSNCNLTDLKGLGLHFLKTLDASHNSISTFKGMGQCPSLSSLNVNWNFLSNMEEEVKNLFKVTRRLADIRLEFNPWTCRRSSNEYALNLFSLLASDLRSNDEIHTTSKEIFGRSHTFSKSEEYLLTLWPVTKTLNRNCSNNMSNLDFFLKTTQFWNHLNPLTSELLNSLKALYLNGVNLTDLRYLRGLEQLEELSIECNSLTSLQGIGDFKNLQVLLAGDNRIKTIANFGFKGLKNLKVLALDNNEISTLTQLKYCRSLQQIYISGNNITDYQSLLALKDMRDLKVLDMRFNPIKLILTQHRLKTLYHLPHLHYLDGKAVNWNELKEAKAYFEGRLTAEFLLASLDIETAEELNHFNFENKGTRSIELTPAEVFSNLRAVNLENNNLTSFEGLLELENLEILWLTGNKISIFHPLDPMATYLPKLKVLSLERNELKSLIDLHLNRIPSIETLFLQDNALTTMSGLAGLMNLRYLVLDRNRIHRIHPKEISNLNRLNELHLDSNRLRDIPSMENLGHLKHLYLRANRLEKLECILDNLKFLSKLSHLSLHENPLTKVMHYRLIALKELPTLQSLDGLKYSPEEIKFAKVLLEENDESKCYGDHAHSLNKPLWPSSIVEPHKSFHEADSRGVSEIKGHKISIKSSPIVSSVSSALNIGSPVHSSRISPVKTRLAESMEKSKILQKLNTKRVIMILPGVSINSMAQFDA